MELRMFYGLTAFFLVPACDSGIGDGPEIYTADVSCDPSESMCDDLFVFEAMTNDAVTDVSLNIWNAGSSKGRYVLSEMTDGDWYKEIWADDIDFDCDDLRGMASEFIAQDAAGQEDSLEL